MAQQDQHPDPLELEFWPETTQLDLGAMNTSLDWLSVDPGHHHDPGLHGLPAPAPLPPGGGSGGDGTANGQMQHQQLLHSQLQSLQPMLTGAPTTAESVS